MYCRNCGSPVKESAQYCTKCGAIIENKKTYNKKIFFITGIILIVLLAFLTGIAGVFVYNHNKTDNSVVGKWSAYSIVSTETGEERTIESLLENEWKEEFNTTEPMLSLEFRADQTFKIQTVDDEETVTEEGTWKQLEDSRWIALFLSSQEPDETGEAAPFGIVRVVDGYLEYPESIRIWKCEREE